MGAGGRFAFAGPWDAELSARAEQLDRERFGERLWRADPSLWSDVPPTRDRIAGRLGWLALPEEPFEPPDPVEGSVLLIGMGGSSLGAVAIADAHGSARLRVLDSTVAEELVAAEAWLRARPPTTAIVASKSGTTVETTALADALDGQGIVKSWAAITDPGTPLVERARARRYDHLWTGRPDVGGRFSALSAFGLVPAALADVSVTDVIASARELRAAGLSAAGVADDPAIRLGLVLGLAALRGRDRIEIHASRRLTALADWIEQLIAESTGKDGRGILPLIGVPAEARPVGDDRLLVALELAGDAPLGEVARQRLETGDRAFTLRFTLPEPAAIGAEMLRWQVATATVGALLGVNPFDEPDVDSAKRRTRALLSGGEPATDAPTIESATALLHATGGTRVAGASTIEEVATRLAEALDPADRPGYLAVLAYLPSAAMAGARALQRALASTGRVVTLGRGPRYLHSTGQLHKGGPATGAFLVVSADPSSVVASDDRLTGLAELARAQALGDLQALRDRGRPATWLHLRGAPDRALRDIARALAPGALLSGDGEPDGPVS